MWFIDTLLLHLLRVSVEDVLFSRHKMFKTGCSVHDFLTSSVDATMLFINSIMLHDKYLFIILSSFGVLLLY